MQKTIIILLLPCLFFLQSKAQVNTTISGQVENLKKDTIKIVLQINTVTRYSQTLYVPVTNGRFTLKIHLYDPVYMYTTDGINYINGLLDPNDDIHIFYNADDPKTTLRFEGKGNQKFTFLNSFIQFKTYNKLKEHVPGARETKHPFDVLFRFLDSTKSAFLKKLDGVRSAMSNKSYDLLKADIIATVMSNKARAVGMVYHESRRETLSKRKAELTPASAKTLTTLWKFDNTLAYSSTYINEVYNMLYMEYDSYIVSGERDKNLLKKYAFLDSVLPSDLRIPVRTLFLESDISKLNQSEDIEAMIEKTFAKRRDTLYQNYITRYYKNATSFKKGMDAPDFTLENEKGEKITLASFKGKTVYLDFWYAACGPCHALFENIKPAKKHFSEGDSVVFLCVSIDRKDAWKSSLEKFKIPGYHVFTENKEGDHPVIKAYKVGGYPTTCIIDKNGKIFMANPPSEPNELIRTMEEANKVR